MALAEHARTQTFAAGEPLLRQGDRADGMFLIVDGTVTVVAEPGDTREPLAQLGPSETVGEMGLLSSDAIRSATVVADTPVTTVFVGKAGFDALLQSSEGVRRCLEVAVETLKLARFIKTAAPFAILDDRTRRALVGRVSVERRWQGDVIFEEGEAGDRCYLVRSGRLEISRTVDGAPTVVTIAGAGALVGETAILTSSPRTATATALDPVELLSISKADLDQVLDMSADTHRRVTDLVRLRHRPTRAPGVEVHQRRTGDRETVSVLKDPLTHRYFQLSPQGLFVWERLDGDANVKDLALAYMHEFRSFGPDAIADLLLRLDHAGFIVGPSMADRESAGRAPKPNIARRVLALLTWQREVRSLDRIMGILHAGGGKYLFTPAAQLILGLIVVAGPAALALSSEKVHAAIEASHPSTVVILFIGLTAAAFVHDGGHALATKHYAREVRGGFGFFWFSPILFIDTSDMWLAPRWQRIVVTLAGPYAGLIFGSLCGLATLLTSNELLLIGLWELSLFAYAETLLNLSPLLELDGYYLLVHVLDRPNLRRRSLAFLYRDLPRAFRDRSVLRGHGFDLLYGLASLGFVAFLSLYAIVMFRLAIRPLLAGVVAPSILTAIGWVLALSVGVLSIVAVVGDLQRAAEAERSSP
jgi:putative peptide zinc metalloprotease protein